MASKRAKELWRLGVPLSRAWLEFAPPELRSEFDKLPRLLEGFAQISESEMRRDPMQRFADVARAQTRRISLEREMKAESLTDLFNGQLLATAFREHPSRSQSPVMIDPEHFDHDDPDWQNETLTVNGVRYGRIRICDPARLHQDRFEPKGSGSSIDNAIEQLMLADSDFCKLPRKIASQKIRDFLGANEITGNGMSDQNLAKFIVRKCGKKRITVNFN